MEFHTRFIQLPNTVCVVVSVRVFVCEVDGPIEHVLNVQAHIKPEMDAGRFAIVIAMCGWLLRQRMSLFICCSSRMIKVYACVCVLCIRAWVSMCVCVRQMNVLVSPNAVVPGTSIPHRCGPDVRQRCERI